MKTTKAFTTTALAGFAALSLGLSFGSVAEAKPALVQRGSHGAYTLVHPKKARQQTQDPKATKTVKQEIPQEKAIMRKEQKQSRKTRSTKIITRGPNGAAFIVYQ